MASEAATGLTPTVVYPESDGKPTGETEAHQREIMNAILTLRDHFRNDPNVYVAGDLLLYYEEGNPQAVVVPDVFVARVEKKVRRTYKLWEEQEPPVLVIEVSSLSSRLEDLGNKRALYAMLGVSEYFVFDPLGEYLKPQLQGFRLQQGELQRVATFQDLFIDSEVLGLRLEVDGDQLRFADPETGRRLLTPSEAQEEGRVAEQARQKAETAARREAEARRVAELRATDLEQELEQLRQQLAKRS